MTKVLPRMSNIHRQEISNSGMKISSLAFLLFCLPSKLAIASTDEDVVRSVAETRQSISTNINGIPVDVVDDVGRVGSCEAVLGMGKAFNKLLAVDRFTNTKKGAL